MKKILVPTDFSEVSENALRFAIEIAKKQEASITLFNSIHFDYFHDFQYATTSLQTMIEEVQQSVQERMEEFLKKYKNEGVEIDSYIDATNLITQIKEMVEVERYELVVVGTSGCSGLEEVFVGSNTEKIVRHTPCPVISVPLGYELHQIKKILIPIDIREIKDTFLRQIAQLQHQFGSEIEFLWVKTPHHIENEERVAVELNELIKSYDIQDFKFTIVRNVFPSDGILIHADNAKADMIAMATHARRGIAHWLSGSLTEDTLNHIQVPVWTFKIQKSEKPIRLASVENSSGKADYKVLPIPTI